MVRLLPVCMSNVLRHPVDRLLRALLVLVCASGLASSEGPRAVAAPTARPNVVLIVGDDMGWQDFGFMGHPVIRTPRLDRLAAESAVFPHGYVPTSLCRASLATLLTGRFGHEHRICCNDPPTGVDRSAMLPFLRDTPTIPRLLAGAGYRALQTGKFWEGHYSNGGFTHGMTTRGRHGEEGLAIGRQTMDPIYRFIRERGAQPFFVWYAPMLPHEPHNPPARLLAKYTAPGRHPGLAKYYAMCEWFDETCGQLFDFLDREGLRDNTLVAFVVDNGWIQETGPTRRTRGNFAPKSKLSPYDGGLRTPVMVRWPGHTRAGSYPDLVSTVDLAPTLLRACRVKLPPGLPGMDLMRAADGDGRLGRKAVFGELYVHTALSVDRPPLNLTHRWVRQGDWKLIVPVDPQLAPELYGLAHDPAEEKDLAAAQPARVAALRETLDRWWKGF